MQFLNPRIKFQNKSFRLTLREDRAILITCVGIALIFWLLVKLSQVYQADKNVVFDLRIPSEKAFLESPPDNLIATVEGQGWDLTFDFFSNSNIVLRYDLSQTNQLDLNRAQLRTAINNSFASNDIRIVELNQEEIHLLLDDKLSKKVPVLLCSDISVAQEYELKDQAILEPDSITITGPASAVENISFWNSDSLILANVKNQISMELELESPPSELILSNQKINVQIPIEQITEKSLFVPIQILNAPDSINIFPKSIRLTCSVGLSRYEELTPDDFKLVVDLKDATSNGSKNTAPIILQSQPDFVENTKFNPLSVAFIIVQADSTNTSSN